MLTKAYILCDMNLVLRTHENLSDPVWGVIIMLAILLIIVTWYIVYILRSSFKELDHGSDDTTKQKELLQLQSDGD